MQNLQTSLRNLLNISTDTTVFPWAKRTPLDGLRATIAVAIALALGQLTGHTSAGAIAAGSAFTVGFAVFHEALASSILSMGLLTLGLASGTLAGSLGAHWTGLVLLLAVIAAVNYGLLSSLGPTEGWMGQQCATFVIVASFFPNGLHYAVGRTAMVLLGGALQMLVFTGFHFLRHRAVISDGDAGTIGAAAGARGAEVGAAEATGARSAENAGVPTPTFSTRLRLRIRQLFAKLLNKATLRGDTASYTIRLAITLLLCTALYRRFHVRNGYWSPMTALLVLKPQWTNTLSRGIARLTGTVLGAGIAVLLAMYVPVDNITILVLVLVSAWACFALQAVNYALFSLFVTLNIVFLFRSGGFSQTSAAHIRLFNTALGGTIALIIDAAWKLFTPKPHPNPTPNVVQAPPQLQ